MNTFNTWLFPLIMGVGSLSLPFHWYGGNLLDTDIKAGRVKPSSLNAISIFAKYGALKRQADQGDRFAWWSLLLAGVGLVLGMLMVLAMFSSPIWRKWLL
ncbi:hypothetical protein NKH57_31290 [Mesorhizobium sp. M1050]|uniref:hypothetical protein n=1 Tax=Mesorhizobium sp. M1050 TaxID=2957051 RepID=UPI00333C2106